MGVEIYPLDRVELDGKSIFLGMKRAEVEAAIGAGQVVRGNEQYYYRNEMKVVYDKDEKVEFVEFLGGIDGLLKPMIYGVSVFDTDAEKLVELLTQKNSGSVRDEEQGYSYQFMEISVGLYREIRPQDVLEMIEEMKADGIPVEGNEDLEADKRRAEHWATIGFGVAGYYER